MLNYKCIKIESILICNIISQFQKKHWKILLTPDIWTVANILTRITPLWYKNNFTILTDLANIKPHAYVSP